MIVSAILPLLSLRAALGNSQDRLQKPIGLAPQHDSAARIGELSRAARQLGVQPGMDVGEAIDICPTLTLIPPDPNRAEDIWQVFLARIEAIGAGVESTRAGEAFFLAEPIERLHGGLGEVLEATANRLGPNVLIGAAPSRLAALAAAHRPEGRLHVIEPEDLQACLDPLPVTILGGRLDDSEEKTRRMTSSLVRLGVHSLGQLRELSRDAMADRFGEIGIEALEMALGIEAPVRPRNRQQRIAKSIELPEVASGIHLQAALTILCDRLAVKLGELGMSARSLVMEARLSGGGSWSRESAPREPTGRADLLRMALAPGLDHLPRPAEQLGLRVSGMATGDSKQIELSRRPGEIRHQRLDEAAHQVRAAVGKAALMRVLDAEAGSHLPERRMLLTPYLSR